jgi:HK97 family phage major capsid protein
VVPASAIANGPLYSPTFNGSSSSGRQAAPGSFRAMFPKTANATVPREFESLGDFARAVLQRDPRLFTNSSGMSEGVAGDGGFFVPQVWMTGLMDTSLTQEAVRPNATIIAMTSAQVNVPAFDTANRSTGIAGLEGKATGEGVTGTAQKAKIRTTVLSAKKISVLVPTTQELMMDAPQLFNSMLQTTMVEALAQTLDTWFISGTGAGSPLGITNAPCLVSVAKDTSQIAATLTPTNIAGMVSRLAPGSWSKAVWLVSPSALAQLFTMQTVVKNVAGTENVGGVRPEFFNVLPDGKFALCGRPLIVSDRLAALGTKGDIILADLSQYLIGMRQGAELIADSSYGFANSEIWFRLNCRIDGQPALNAPITPRVGSATLSPFVTLDAR